MSVDLFVGIAMGVTATVLTHIANAFLNRKRAVQTLPVKRHHYEVIKPLKYAARQSYEGHQELWQWLAEHYPETREGEWTLAEHKENGTHLLIRWNR